MGRPDLILLHAPSVYDFRENLTLYGPISDVIPSTPIFDMYPLGFVSIVGYLQKHGYKTQIINLAARMLKDRRFSVEDSIRKLRPTAFGIDLHWLVHAHGSLEIAKVIKRYHPEIPVIMGGLSASYYHIEILTRYPQIDYVLKGDSTEKPLLDLLQHIEQGQPTKDIPNLSWRDENGRIHANPITYVPDTLNDFVLDYSNIVQLVISHRDLKSNLPYESWLEYPFTALIVCKGCTHNCITCGGSNKAYRMFYNREKVTLKSPTKIAEEMATIEDYVKGPIFLVGDLQVGGNGYAQDVLKEIRKQRIDNPIVFELFTPSREFVRSIAENCTSFCLEISPESHDETIRSLQGRYYSNHELETTIDTALNLGCRKCDVFFMVGLPAQNSSKALDTIEYARYLLQKHRDKRLHPFIAPLAPFLDPGSLAFESPERYGYRVLFRTLDQHREALAMPTWKHYLNYETLWMNRKELVATTYEAMQCMNQLKLEFGLLDHSKALAIAQSIRQSSELVDSVEVTAFSQASSADLEELRETLEAVDRVISDSKEELRVSARAEIKKGAIAKHITRYILGTRRRM